MRARREDDGAGEAEVREQQLAEILIDGLAFGVDQPDRDILEGQTLHPCAVVSLLDQRDEGADRLHDRMAERGGKPIAVAGRAGSGIGQAAGRENDAVGRDRSGLRLHAGHAAAGRGQLRHAPRQQLHMVFMQETHERVQYGLRPVGDREHAVSTLGLERAAVLLKKGPGVRGGKAREGAVEKARVRRHVLQNVLPRAVVRDVAPALAGDEQFFAGAAVLLEQRHMRAGLRRHPGGHHARRAAAHDDDLIRPVQRRHIHPKAAPDPHRFLPRCLPAAARPTR